MRPYSYRLTFFGRGDGVWEITKAGDKGYHSMTDRAVWSTPWRPEHEDDSGQPPLEVRGAYERLLREAGWLQQLSAPEPNVVEILTDADGCAWDQPCAHGHRVESYAVYCHNRSWLYAPTKCRRHKGGDEPWPHEGCPGFLANPLCEGAKR